MRVNMTQEQMKDIESKTQALVFALQCLRDQNIDNIIAVEDLNYTIDRVKIAAEVGRKLYFTTK